MQKLNRGLTTLLAIATLACVSSAFAADWHYGIEPALVL